MVVDPTTGATVLGKKKLDGVAGILDVLKLDPVHAVFACRGLDDAGRFIVVNTLSGQCGSPATFEDSLARGGGLGFKTWARVSQTSVAVFYSDYSLDRQVGTYRVYNINGTPESNMLTFNGEGDIFASTAVTLGCNLILAYDVNGGGGKFQIFGGVPSSAIFNVLGSATPGFVCYPNPFRSRVTLRFVGASHSATSISIYDPQGQLVRALGFASQGTDPASVTWYGTDANGKRVPNGEYLFRINDGVHVTSEKAMLFR
jgi:hypothetical protein